MGTRSMGVGILGAGEVASQYVPNLVASDEIELIGVGDLNYRAAEQLAQKYHIPKVFSGEDILGCKEIELVVNLTPIQSHFETNLRILESGKHVYSEKPLALTTRSSAALLATAEESGLSVGCAPDTVLGPGFQAGRRAIDRGLIGKPLLGFASMLRPLPVLERNRTGAIPLFDMAPYYLSALVNLFGSATWVSGITRLSSVAPRTDQSAIFTSCSMRFMDDVLCTLTLRWGDTPSDEVPILQIFGTQGVLCLPNPDTFSAFARWRRHGELSWHRVAEAHGRGNYTPNLRGIGVADMAQAIRQGKTPRSAPDVALHVVEILETLSLTDPSTDGVGGRLQTACSKPSLLRS